MILSFCPSCGFIFRSQAFGLTGTGITMDNVQESCPRCNAMANVLDGTFDISAGIIRVLAAPGWTRSVLKHVLAILKKRAETPEQKEEIVKEVSAVSPELAALLSAALKTHKSWGYLIALLIFALSRTSIDLKHESKSET